jgi:hypothetical protein
VRTRRERLALAAARVGTPTVVRLRTASLEFAAFCLGHRRGRLAADRHRPAGGTGVAPGFVPKRLLELLTATWASGPLTVAAGHRARRTGLTPAPGPIGALLACRSVHTFGMACSIAVVALDSTGVVVHAEMLRPGRVRWFPRATFVAEVSSEALPRVGERTAVRPILARWPAP